MSALGLSTTRSRRSLLQRIAEAFPPPAQWPAFVAFVIGYAVLIGMLLRPDLVLRAFVGVLP